MLGHKLSLRHSLPNNHPDNNHRRSNHSPQLRPPRSHLAQ